MLILGNSQLFLLDFFGLYIGNFANLLAQTSWIRYCYLTVLKLITKGDNKQKYEEEPFYIPCFSWFDFVLCYPQ